MFISSHPKRHQKNGNVTCLHVCSGDLLLCDKWKCQRTAHERDSDRSFLNNCDGCHVQEEHIWINVEKTVNLSSEPAVMSPCDCRAFLMWIKCFFAGFLQIPWTWNCNLTFPFYSFHPRSPTHLGSVGLCPPVYPWQPFLCETSVFEQRLSLLLLQLHLLSAKSMNGFLNLSPFFLTPDSTWKEKPLSGADISWRQSYYRSSFHLFAAKLLLKCFL